jgi:hypothetical protein
MTKTTTPPGYCLFFVDSWQTCMPKSEWAGWVQAIGSIAALVIAICIMRSQHRSAQRLEADRRLRNRLDQVDGVNALLLRVRSFLRLARPAKLSDAEVRKSPALSIDRTLFDRDFMPALKALRAVPVHTFGAAAFFLQQALDQAEAARAVLEELLRTRTLPRGTRGRPTTFLPRKTGLALLPCTATQ